jgi:hypothetical protein
MGVVNVIAGQASVDASAHSMRVMRVSIRNAPNSARVKSKASVTHRMASAHVMMASKARHATSDHALISVMVKAFVITSQASATATQDTVELTVYLISHASQ